MGSICLRIMTCNTSANKVVTEDEPGCVMIKKLQILFQLPVFICQCEIQTYAVCVYCIMTLFLSGILFGFEIKLL
jgi:hypothetical protein